MKSVFTLFLSLVFFSTLGYGGDSGHFQDWHVVWLIQDEAKTFVHAKCTLEENTFTLTYRDVMGRPIRHKSLNVMAQDQWGGPEPIATVSRLTRGGEGLSKRDFNYYGAQIIKKLQHRGYCR